MSLRPPSTYRIRVTAQLAAGSSDSANFTLAASGESKVPLTIGADLHLQGVYFEAAADGLNYIATPSSLPAGVTAPHNITTVVSGPSFLEFVDATINNATTAFPFQLCYGPLGPGGR